jgi:transglutaminase-like putative cysteine protease
MAQFQTPTDEELKMTSDPKAPGAAAVYLNIEEVANDPLHYQSVYARIKVLTEKGKELATQEVPYLKGNFKITDIKARTIHSDGTIIPLAGKPEDLLVSKSGDQQIERKVFTLPSVEVGSILEFTYTIRYDDNHYSSPMWEIQRDYFVHKAHYQFTPERSFTPGAQVASSIVLTDSKGRAVNSLIWWSKLPNGVTIQTNAAGFYFVDVTDTPPKPDEEYMPPIESFLYKVFFYYKSASTAQDFWVGEAKDWSKDADRFAEQSKTIREAVAGLIAPGDSELVRAQKIYKAVEALDNTDYSRKKGESELKQLNLKEAKHAEDTWKQKSGSSEDIALLYLAMVRAAGLTAYAEKVVARDQGVFDVTYMNVNQLNDTVVLVAIDGKGVLVDPGEKMAPFQTLNWRHSEAGGLRQSGQGPGYQATPPQPYTINSTMRTADIFLDGHGGVTGTIRVVMSGQAALHWRQAALRNDEKEVKKQFDEELESLVPDGVEAHVDHFLGMDDPETNLMAIVKTQGTLGTATSKRVLLPGFFFEAPGNTPFVSQEKRQEAVDMHYGDQISEEVVYHLPDGVTVEGAPADGKIPWTGHAALVTKTVSTPGQIVVSRTLARAFSQAKPEEYQDLRGFYQKVAASDQQKLVLSVSAPAAKGN